MARTFGAIGKRSIITNDRFEQYVEHYGDPLELMFAIMANKLRKPRGKARVNVPFEMQAQAAKELLAYGYSRRAPSPAELGDDRDYVISWEQDDLFNEEGEVIDDTQNSNTLPAPVSPKEVTQGA